jgi:hypothetical protein
LEEHPPKVLYHYTTHDGLLGILKKHALWASKIKYMNDSSELIEPLRIANIELNNFRKQLIEEKSSVINSGEIIKRDKIIRAMSGELFGWEDVNLCVVSFCQEGDLLSQWRGYGVPSSSYSIGFDTEKLVKNLNEDKSPFELHMCKYYNREDYQQKIHQFIEQTIDGAIKNKNNTENFIDKFFSLIARMKLDYFKEEQEWRLVSRTPVSFDSENFKFRVSKSMIIPYYSISLNLSSIVEIIVGPCQQPDLVRNAIMGLAMKFNLNNLNIKVTQIPWRTF